MRNMRRVVLRLRKLLTGRRGPGRRVVDRRRGQGLTVDAQSTPLSGLLVLALEQAVAAPYCSSRLADAGARVIKVERPEGDFARGYDAAVNGLASYFVWLNRGKESLVADIKQHYGCRSAACASLREADVFIQNLAPGAAARAGFGCGGAASPAPSAAHHHGYHRLRQKTTATAAMKAYDLLVQAESGLASDHRTSGRPGPRRRFGVRHRLRHVSACRGAGGADRPRDRTGGGVAAGGQPVRRHGRLDECAAAMHFEGTGQRARSGSAWRIRRSAPTAPSRRWPTTCWC